MSQPIASGSGAQPRSSAITFPLALEDRWEAKREMLKWFYEREETQQRAQEGTGASQRPKLQSKRKISTTTLKIVPPPAKKRKQGSEPPTGKAPQSKPKGVVGDDDSYNAGDTRDPRPTKDYLPTLGSSGRWTTESALAGESSSAHIWKPLGRMCDVRDTSVPLVISTYRRPFDCSSPTFRKRSESMFSAMAQRS